MVMDMDDHERNTPEPEPSEHVEVCGSRRLTAEEIQFADVYPILDEGLLGFCMYWPDDFNLDEVFGLVGKAARNAYADVYAAFDVRNQYKIILLVYAHELNIFYEEYFDYRLQPHEQEIFKKKMEQFCMEETGLSMNDYFVREQAQEEAFPRRAETAGLLYRQHVTYRFMPADGESEGLKLDRNMFWDVIDSTNAAGPYPDQETWRCSDDCRPGK